MRGRFRSARLFFLALPIFTAACGGGGGTGGVQPSPPSPDFSITLSSNSVSVTQGSASTPINVSIAAQNSFVGDVQVSISGLPAGVATNPASPFSVSAGQSVALLFGAAANAQTGQFTVTAQGTSGTLSHSQSLSLAIQAAPQTNLPRTRYVENDFVTALDTPAGQPHRRHVVYDAANQRFYVANLAMNRVEVFSASAPSLLTTIPAPGASSVDLSADGSTLWVGTNLEQILAIDTTALQVKARYPIAGVAPIPNVVFIRPTEALALAGGELLVRLRQPAGTQALWALWDPPTNTFTNLTSFAPAVFQNGVGVLARSGDHTCALAAANDTSGELAVFSSSGFDCRPAAPLAGAVSSAAINSDGSLFAVAVSAGGGSRVLLMNGNLGMLASYSSTGATGLVFSADGQSLYVDEPYGNSSVVSVLSTSTMQKTGQVPDIPIQGVPTTIEELGSGSYLVGLNNRGVAFLDASQPTSLPLSAPVLSSAPSAQPAEGPAAGGTAVSLSGVNFSANAQMAFGAGNPTNATMASATQLQVSSPASASAGPVNLTAYFPNGWLAVAPASFSYGPVVSRVLPNVGKPQGGDTLTVLGYGFGTAAGSVTVKSGGSAASVQSVQASGLCQYFGPRFHLSLRARIHHANHARWHTWKSGFDHSIFSRFDHCREGFSICDLEPNLFESLVV